jgi:hypothetical protein
VRSSNQFIRASHGCEAKPPDSESLERVLSGEASQTFQVERGEKSSKFTVLPDNVVTLTDGAGKGF